MRILNPNPVPVYVTSKIVESISMSAEELQLSHHELSVLIYSLQGPDEPVQGDSTSCETACPIIDSVEHLLCGGEISREDKLIRHLNNHVRDALIQCGVFELMALKEVPEQAASPEHQTRLAAAHQRLNDWSCEIRLNREERAALLAGLKRMPSAAWLSMPKLMWRLRKKLKAK